MALGGFAAVGPADASLRSFVDRELHISPARMARIFDAAGTECARLEACTQLSVCGTNVTVTNQLSGFSRIPAAVEDAWGEEELVPVGTARATGVIHFGLQLRDGQRLNGITVVPYRFDRGDLVAPMKRTISHSRCERLGEVRVILSSTSEWQPRASDLVTPPSAAERQPARELVGLTR